MSRPRLALGINGLNLHTHDAAACLVADGEVVAASAEERFTGVKHSSDFPRHAVRFCLDRAGVGLSAVDRIGYPFSPSLRLREGLRYLAANLPASLRLVGPGPLADLAEKRALPRRLAEACGGDAGELRRRMMYAEHHLAHAATAFFGSPFFEAAILTLDGIGEMDAGMIAAGVGNAIHPLRRFRFPDSAGLLYRAVTEHLGFRADGDEGKVMGLAPYGDDRFLASFRPLVAPRRDGFSLDRRFFNTLYYPSAGRRIAFTTPAFTERFGPAREPGEPLGERHMALARALQETLEALVLHLGRMALDLTGLSNLCLAGGVALNSCANGRLLSLPRLREIYVQPASADDGGALGAALLAARELDPKLRPRPPRMPFFGHDPADDIARGPLDLDGLDEIRPADLTGELVRRLAAGEVVAVCRGRAEFGPRALGHRSILADPRDPDMRRRLNEEVKGREWFRPYAPVVPLERAGETFAGAREAPHMLLVFPVREAWRERVPAVTHVDGSARVQTIRREDDPFLHGLVTAFGVATGAPVLLNTSFNGPGKPLVNTAADALATFRERPIDALLLGDRLFVKRMKKA